jgi:Tol biopolymer transport system component
MGNAAPGGRTPGDRLESWKRIAAYLKRDVSTVQRWERREGMPIHRHVHDKVGSVFAFRSELDAWWESRRIQLESNNPEPAHGASLRAREPMRTRALRPGSRTVLLIALVPLLWGAVLAWRTVKDDYFWHNPLANARFSRLADLGTEHAAAISRDGRLVAVLAKRDDQSDVWLSEGDRDSYRNLTQGALRDLNVTNAAIRALGFSPDSSIYFVRGVPESGEWDIWRIRPSGADLERVTTHNTQVSYPVFLDRHTLLYLATDDTGAGPWIYAMDIERRSPHRVSSGLESYKSLAGNVDGTRLVATFASFRTSLWRLSLGDGIPAGEAGTKLTLIDTDGSAPRLGPDAVVYVALRAGRQSIWKRSEAQARELWVNEHTRILGRPAPALDGRVAFTVLDRNKTLLYVMDADGKHVQLITDALTLRGDTAWSPDGQSLVAGVARDGEPPRLTRISLRGEAPLDLVPEYSLDPVWSPDGKFLLYYGADVGTSFPVRAAAADGRPYAVPALMLPRGSRVAFARDPQTLYVLRVDPRQATLLQVDLHTGTQRTIYQLPGDFIARDFDIAPNGREIILDRVEDNSDVALIERAR